METMISNQSVPGVRPARDEDEPELVSLFQRAFNRKMSGRLWRWKLGTVDRTPVSWVAEMGGNIVGHYGGMAVPVARGELRGTAMVSVHAMVDPDYRRRGILTDLVRTAHRSWREEGIVFVMALLNEQWGSLRQSLGWRLAGSLAWKVRVLDPGAVLSRRLKLPLTTALSPFTGIWNRLVQRALKRNRELETRSMNHPISELERLLAAHLPSDSISVSREPSWIRRRYLDAPHHRYYVLAAFRESSPVGYAVTRLDRKPGRSLGIVADLMAEPDALDELLAGSLEWMRGQGADLSAILAMPGSELDRLAERAGFRNRWGAFDLWVVGLSPEWPIHDSETPPKWRLQGGDFDVV